MPSTDASTVVSQTGIFFLCDNLAKAQHKDYMSANAGLTVLMNLICVTKPP
jgi:hypothetical protein